VPDAPSIVPGGPHEVYLVLDDFGGNFGRVWRETAEANAQRDALIRDLLEGQYANPVRIVAFNTGQGWSRDVTREIARELADLCADREHAPDSVVDLIAAYATSGQAHES
jgi:hypothetical protein